MKRFFYILSFIKDYWNYALLNAFFNILTVFFSLFSLTLVAPFLNVLFFSDSSGGALITKKTSSGFINGLINRFNDFITNLIATKGKMEALIFICALVLIMIILKNFFRFMGQFFMAPIRNGVVKDIRNKMYAKILELPLSFYSEERKGDIIARMSSDVTEIEWAIMQSLEAVFREPIAVIFFLITLFYMSVKLTLFVFVLLPITGFILGKIGKTLRGNSGKSKEHLGSLISIIEETLSGLRIIKGFNAENFMKEKFFALNEKYNKMMITIYRKTDLSSPLSETLGVTSLVIIMLYGGHLVINEQSLSPSVFITYIAVFSQVIDPAKSFSNAYYNAQKGIASAERIAKILDAQNTVVEKTNPIEISSFKTAIEYKNVSFSYSDKKVLDKISFTIKKGETVALVGQSGSGKSTIADLLPRFYDVADGEITIDGLNIKNCSIASLRNLMGIVTQESVLFNDTVMANIAFSDPNPNEQKIIEAAKIANAHDFIMQLENGYLTTIGDRGSKLSGGQRQRLSIARAIYKNPPILILDEATSALDTESERLVQEALKNLMKNRTTLVIAHRLSTIQYADKILVIHNGSIVEYGTHEDLLALNGQYKKLYDVQVFS
jgi:subfamily B ATP-binding cassette protein MsbA